MAAVYPEMYEGLTSAQVLALADIEAEEELASRRQAKIGDLQLQIRRLQTRNARLNARLDGSLRDLAEAKERIDRLGQELARVRGVVAIVPMADRLQPESEATLHEAEKEVAKRDAKAQQKQ